MQASRVASQITAPCVGIRIVYVFSIMGVGMFIAGVIAHEGFVASTVAIAGSGHVNLKNNCKDRCRRRKFVEQSSALSPSTPVSTV